jgi:hypothetical protein
MRTSAHTCRSPVVEGRAVALQPALELVVGVEHRVGVRVDRRPLKGRLSLRDARFGFGHALARAIEHFLARVGLLGDVALHRCVALAPAVLDVLLGGVELSG